MLAGPLATLECLALASSKGTFARLLPELRRHGCRVDLVLDLEAAQQKFMQRGGHAVLLLAPDLPPGICARAHACMRAVDPALRVLVFGSAPLRTRGRREVERLPSFHPSARAGIVAVLRALGQNA